ncbi:MAG: hypothetical protein AAGF66_16820 [Cyanobacteria bacterium P01_H01_bin.119]
MLNVKTGALIDVFILLQDAASLGDAIAPPAVIFPPIPGDQN